MFACLLYTKTNHQDVGLNWLKINFVS